jgi:hypothetical protein
MKFTCILFYLLCVRTETLVTGYHYLDSNIVVCLVNERFMLYIIQTLSVWALKCPRQESDTIPWPSSL